MAGKAPESTQHPHCHAPGPWRLTGQRARCIAGRHPGRAGWLPCWSGRHGPGQRRSQPWVERGHSGWTCRYRGLKAASEGRLRLQEQRHQHLQSTYCMPRPKRYYVPILQGREDEAQRKYSSPAYCGSKVNYRGGPKGTGAEGLQGGIRVPRHCTDRDLLTPEVLSLEQVCKLRPEKRSWRGGEL